MDEDKSSLPTHDGTKVQVWSCSGQSNQLWQLWNDSTIRSTYDGRCLDADVSGAIQDGTKVQVWTCTGADNQRWTVDPDGEIESSLVDNDLNSFVLDEDTSGGSHDGAKVQIWHATGASNQSWYSRIRGVSDGRCLDEDVSSTTHDGTKVQMWTCTGSSNQRWVLLQDGAIVNRHDSRCLDADVSSPLHAGTKVQVWSCTFDAINPYVHVYNQRWLHHLNFTFLPDSVLDTFCLDEDKSSTLHDGTKVQLWSCSSQANQQWNTW